MDHSKNEHCQKPEYHFFEHLHGEQVSLKIIDPNIMTERPLVIRSIHNDMVIRYYSERASIKKLSYFRDFFWEFLCQCVVILFKNLSGI